MPRGFFRQYPLPSDYGVADATIFALTGAMFRTFWNRLRGIQPPPLPETPDPAPKHRSRRRGRRKSDRHLQS